MPTLPCFDVGEEVSSVKDSVTSGIPVNQPTEESTGVLDVQPIGDEMELTLEGLQAHRQWVLKKMVSSTEEKERDDFILDPVVMKASAPLDYSESISDTVSLVGKGPVMTRPSPGASMPYAVRVG